MNDNQKVVAVLITLFIIAGAVGGAVASALVGGQSFGVSADSTNYTNLGAKTLKVGTGCDDSGTFSSCTGFTLSAAGVASLLGLFTADGGITHSYTNATSSSLTAQTLQAADILNYETVLFTPNTAATTLTFPATSTLSAFIPSAGDWAEQCWLNSTTTVAASITFVAGTGMDFERVATTTTSGSAGNIALVGSSSGCFKFVRKANTDISVLLTPYIDAD